VLIHNKYFVLGARWYAKRTALKCSSSQTEKNRSRSVHSKPHNDTAQYEKSYLKLYLLTLPWVLTYWNQPTNQWVLGAISLAVRWLENEADHSLPSSSKVKNAWHCTSTPPVHLHGVVLR
jgi:hypothetical protein